MSKWPITTDDDVERLARHCGWGDNRRYMTPTDYAIWCERMRQFAALALAPAPVASAEDVERVAQVIHDAEKASFIRNGGAWIGSTPDGRHYEQARAALRAMGHEVKG